MPLESAVLPAAPAGFDTPLLAIAVTRGGLPASLASLDQATGGALGRLFAAGDFSGKKDETALIYPPGPAPRVLLVGLGKTDESSAAVIRRAASAAAKRARTLGVPRAAFHLPSEALGSVRPADAGQAIGEGLAQGAWQYSEMKRPPEEKKPPLDRFDVLAPTDSDAVTRGHRIGAAIGAGQTVARGIQVLPGNVCTPAYVARTAEEIAAERIGVTVLDKAAIVKEGMGALMAVAQGSVEEPRFIALEYKGAADAPVVRTTGAWAAPLYSSAMKRGSSTLPSAWPPRARPCPPSRWRTLSSTVTPIRGGLRSPPRCARRTPACTRFPAAPGCPAPRSGPRRWGGRRCPRVTHPAPWERAHQSDRAASSLLWGRFIFAVLQQRALREPCTDARHRRPAHRPQRLRREMERCKRHAQRAGPAWGGGGAARQSRRPSSASVLPRPTSRRA